MRAAIEAPYRFTEDATAVVDLEAWFHLADLDADWAVRCQNRGHEGEQPAEWIIWLARCCPRKRRYLLWCTTCRDGALREMASSEHTCPHCRHRFAPMTAVVRLIEPLNRRTA